MLVVYTRLFQICHMGGDRAPATRFAMLHFVSGDLNLTDSVHASRLLPFSFL